MVQWGHFVKYRQNPASDDMSPDLGKINWRCTCTSNKTHGCVNSVCVRVCVRTRAFSHIRALIIKLHVHVCSCLWWVVVEIFIYKKVELLECLWNGALTQFLLLHCCAFILHLWSVLMRNLHMHFRHVILPNYSKWRMSLVTFKVGHVVTQVADFYLHIMFQSQSSPSGTLNWHSCVGAGFSLGSPALLFHSTIVLRHTRY